jgi:hypothetical protein
VLLLATSTSEHLFQVRSRSLHHSAATNLPMANYCQGLRRRPGGVAVRTLRFSVLSCRGFDSNVCLHIKGGKSCTFDASHFLRPTHMPALRNLRTHPFAPPALPSIRTRISSSPDPLSLRSLLDIDVTTPEAIGEVDTEPSTPTTPPSRTRAFSRALQRQRSARFVHVVFHYDRTQNGLQPWFW